MSNLKSNLEVSCVQVQPKLGEFEYNVSCMEKYIEDIMAERPDTKLIVFPELMTSGYELPKNEFLQIAEKVTDGESMKRVGALCEKYGVNVVYGFPEKAPEDNDIMYNSAVMIGSKGEIIGNYRKVHPFDTEKRWCKEGSELKVFDTEFGKVGIMICWDVAFPEVARVYALQGAELLIVSTNWENPFSEDWDLITKARAFDNTLHLVAANRIGPDKNLSWFGHSKIVSPVGKDIEALDDDVEGVIHSKIDLTKTEDLRKEYYTFFNDRQPSVYMDIVKE